MALFTGKGDNGTTKTFGCDQRISKSSIVAEALGALDETNSYIGFARAKSKDRKATFKIENKEIKFSDILYTLNRRILKESWYVER